MAHHTDENAQSLKRVVARHTVHLASYFDVIVIGGGVIGSTIAWRLGQSGRRVLLVERETIGCEASSAAAGMLGAQLEVHEPGDFFDLCVQSRALFPTVADELRAETGIDIQYNHNGILHVAKSQEDAIRLQARMAWQVEAGLRAEWMTASDVQSVEPLAHAPFGGLFLPDDGNVHAPSLMRALENAVKRNATVLERTEVLDIQTSDSEVSVKVVGGEVFRADHAVICAGAWADRIMGLLPLQASIRPVKGQLLSVRPRSGATLQKTVFTEDVYLVPKQDGTIVVGATEEHGAGYDKQLTIDGLSRLMDSIGRAAPGLKDAVFERAWVGLRPRSPSGYPMIGIVPDSPRIAVAIGHFRNGILLSAITGQMIVSALNGGSNSPLWDKFAPFREVCST